MVGGTIKQTGPRSGMVDGSEKQTGLRSCLPYALGCTVAAVLPFALLLLFLALLFNPVRYPLKDVVAGAEEEYVLLRYEVTGEGVLYWAIADPDMLRWGNAVRVKLAEYVDDADGCVQLVRNGEEIGNYRYYTDGGLTLKGVEFTPISQVQYYLYRGYEVYTEGEHYTILHKPKDTDTARVIFYTAGQGDTAPMQGVNIRIASIEDIGLWRQGDGLYLLQNDGTSWYFNANTGTLQSYRPPKPKTDYAVEQWYPLHEGAVHNMFYPDVHHYYEEILYRSGDYAVARVSDSNIASHYTVYRVSDTVVWQVAFVNGITACEVPRSRDALLWARLGTAATALEGAGWNAEQRDYSVFDAWIQRVQANEGTAILRIDGDEQWAAEYALTPGDAQLVQIPEAISARVDFENDIVVATSYEVERWYGETSTVVVLRAYSETGGLVMAYCYWI